MFTFHTRTEALASFDSIPDALAYAQTLPTYQGVAVTMPQGGELNSHMFEVWARQMTRRGLVTS